MIAWPPSDGLFADQEQFRMCNLQVFNWGTFSDLHNIPIAAQGFLFVGPSGSGKTTLLDAFSALLVPPRWIDFNAAARETDRSGRDRNLVTYVRGAWAEQKDEDSGEIARRYLRTGTTWSAIALSFRNTRGQAVVLVQVFWIRGAGSSREDVKRHYLIFERPFDLREMQHFDLDVRNLKRRFPEAFAKDEFPLYSERFRRLLGIETELALRLLHKTQSAKNLGDLNTFLRDFMLDRPETFEAAERLVTEFAELNAAHQAVVTARDQVQTLTPAREEYGRLQIVRSRQKELLEIRAGVDSYRQIRRMSLLAERIAVFGTEIEGFRGEAQTKEAALVNAGAVLDDLRRQHQEMGGGRIQHLESEKTRLERDRTERIRKRKQAQEACEKLGWTLPETPQAFAETAASARQEIDGWPTEREALQQRQIDLAHQKAETEKEFRSTVEEVESMRRQPSAIPSRMLALRRRLAQGLGLSDSSLPFSGELMEVDPQHAVWRGAAERVLRGFALSLLVEERHYAAVSSFVNENQLAGRLVYFRLGRTDASFERPVLANSLFHKLRVKEGACASWLQAELRQRFDYACVDSMQAFRSAEKAATREGQVRHGKDRHEKDDRFPIDDPSNWVLGFDNRDKLALFERKAQQLADVLSSLDANLKALKAEDAARAGRALTCQMLANMQWQEIHVAPLLERIAAIDRMLEEERKGNIALREIGDRIEKQKGAVERAGKALRDVQARILSLEKELQAKQSDLQTLQQNPGSLTQLQSRELTGRFESLNQPLALDNIDRLSLLVERSLGKELETKAQEDNALVRGIEDSFANFRRRWAMDAGDLDSTLASAPDYFAILTRLETDGLPAHERRFFELLRTQSHQNLAALSTHISQSRRTILDRMELVNESLSQAEFNPGTYLHIDATDRQLPEVREFKQEITQALSYAWTDDNQQAERRFLVLRGLVERLASQEPEQRRWRELMLDVRQHVEFIGRELDAVGTEVEVYRSGAGKSGGQRQKLATTCLAAALRYQLGGHGQGVPMYAPVVLDEAFDKADNEFTALAMNIFANFGFQMIVATPLKSVMTLEPFIGGACFVDIRDRRHSGVLLIEYDADRKRLKLPEQQTHGDAQIPIS